MATITLSITPGPIPAVWESPAAEYVNTGIWPSSKILFLSTGATVLAKDAANETIVVFTLVLPSNFFYRLSLFNISMASSALASFVPATGFELFMEGDIFEGADSIYRFSVTNNALGNAIQEGGYKSLTDATSNDFSTTYSPVEQVGDLLIDASNGATIVINFMDTSDDATAAAVIRCRFEFMQYTIEQALAAPINTPTLIY